MHATQNASITWSTVVRNLPVGFAGGEGDAIEIDGRPMPSLDPSPLVIVGTITLTSSIGQQLHCLLGARVLPDVTTYWALYWDRNADGMAAIPVLGDSLDELPVPPAQPTNHPRPY